MKPLRALYLTHYAELYGANRSLVELVVAARATGKVDPFVVLACDGPLRTELLHLGIAHAVVPFTSWMHKRVLMGGPHHRLMQRWRHYRAGVVRTRGNASQLKLLHDLAIKERIGLVHSNSSVIPIGGALARSLGVPFVWHIRELPFKHYHFHVDGGKGRYARELRRADAIIALSEAVASDVVEIAGPMDKIAVVPNGVVGDQVTENAQEVAHERWRSIPTFNFVLAALFHRSKGQAEAVEAFARLHRSFPNTALHLVGGGRTEEVRALAAESGAASAIHFTGFVARMHEVLPTMHAVLQCSRHEALGRITLEGMAHGLPVIGHASGATPVLITHGVNGLLYTRPEDLFEAMRTLVKDHAAAERMGAAGRDMVVRSYTVRLMCDRTLAVYDRLRKN